MAEHRETQPENHSSVPITLTSLPLEILSSIVTFLDKPASLSFARVARCCTLPAEAGFWKDLDLFLPPWFTDPPKVAAYFRRNGNRNYDDPVLAEHRRLGKEAHQRAIQQRISGLIGKAEGRHWRMVKGVRVVPRAGTVDEFVQLLRLAAPTLLKLELESPSSHDYSSDWDLDIVLIKARLHFPSLVTIRLGYDAVGYALLIPLLCNAAPNLVSLDLTLDHVIDYPPPVDDRDIPIFASATKLRMLRLVFLGDTYYHRGGPEPAVLALFARIPLIEALSLTHGDWNEAYYPVIATLRRSARLRDLRWGYDRRDPYRSNDFRWEGDSSTTETGELSIRRLGLFHCPGWLDIFSDLPPLPKLQTLYIDGGFPSQYNDFYQPLSLCGLAMDRASSARDLLPAIADRIRQSPYLSAIQDISGNRIEDTPDVSAQFDEYDAREHTDYINSYRNGVREMLHVGVWILDKPDHEQQICNWTFHQHTDLDGIVVPLEVIQRMKEVEGDVPCGWGRRGVEVGDGAWSVVTHWEESLMLDDWAIAGV